MVNLSQIVNSYIAMIGSASTLATLARIAGLRSIKVPNLSRTRAKILKFSGAKSSMPIS